MSILKKLRKLKKRVFTAKEANKLGISSRMLHYYTKTGIIKRIAQGVYIYPEAQNIDLESIYKERLAAIPNGIIGLMSALQFHGLTEEASREISIIVPENNYPKRKFDDVVYYRVKKELYKVETYVKKGIAITTLERTMVDLLRVGKPVSLILDAIYEARSKRMSFSIPKLIKLGKMFRVKNKINQLLDALK